MGHSVSILPELSWLRFNRRVLLQTERLDFPLLERLRFIAIWARNLDEFLTVRIARPFLKDRERQEYRALLQEVRFQKRLARARYEALLDELRPKGLEVLPVEALDEEERAYFGVYLAEVAVPRTDLLDWTHIKDLTGGALYFASELHLVRLPQDLPRLLPVPGREGRFVRLGELFRLRSDLLLPEPQALYEFRVLRLKESERDRVDWDELPKVLEDRMEGVFTHLEAEEGFPSAWLSQLRETLGLKEEETDLQVPPLDLSLVEGLVEKGPAGLRFPPLRPERPKAFLKNPLAHLRRKDLLLYHPFQDYRAVEKFAQAALEPEIEEIWATLYRIGPENPLAETLIQAARMGKRVHVLLEARARFDELLNLAWYLRFRRAGVEIVSLPERKVHAKAFLLLGKERGFAHLGTGNYNPQNGARYTDFSYFTSHKEVLADLHRFFLALRDGQEPILSHLYTGPRMREVLLEHIRREAHPKGRIILKFNHLTDPEILQALLGAAQKGSKVQLIVRSTLTLLDPRLEARSLVGRFLEHARVAAFREGGRWRVYMGSADAMPRNFDRRYELFFPVLDEEARKGVLGVLKRQLKDDRNAFLLSPEGEVRLWGGQEDAQAW
ncbi:MAG: polyphosphate kinase [Thermaceae bacterium]